MLGQSGLLAVHLLPA